MKKLILYTIGFTSFLCCVNNKKEDSQKSWIEQKTVVEAITIPSISKVKNGVKFINTGPRGGSYINSDSTEIRYTIFRVQIVNDTIIPLNLELNFPKKTIELLPDSSVLLNISIIPDSLTPDNIQNNLNFGVIGIEEFFESELSERYMLKTSIQPNEQHIVYIGIKFASELDNGTTRSILFINGQDIVAPFLPQKSIEINNKNPEILDLVYGIGVDPPNNYNLIPCGKIKY